ncbi:MAG: acyloxyacyl hydrolase [Burkholderiales bacterium]
MSSILGAGNHVSRAGVEAQAPACLVSVLSDEWAWSLRWAGNVSYWWSRKHSTSNSSLSEAGLTPVVNLRRAADSLPSGYLEAGVGIHLLSHTSIDERIFSTAFQFGELVGMGINFGEREQYGIGLRVQHISNGGIKEPNYGMTFGELRFAYRWN